jgi:hypothetical protein
MSGARKTNKAFHFSITTRDLKLKPGQRRMFTSSGPYNMPARYVRTKGFSGFSQRLGRDWSTLPYALESARDAMHERCWGERRWRGVWEKRSKNNTA